MLNRARDPPAAIISAPIPIHKVTDHPYASARNWVNAAIAYRPNPNDQANWYGLRRPSHCANTRDANARLITVAPSEIAAPSKLIARAHRDGSDKPSSRRSA